jgi:hypothetical protein
MTYIGKTLKNRGLPAGLGLRAAVLALAAVMLAMPYVHGFDTASAREALRADLAYLKNVLAEDGGVKIGSPNSLRAEALAGLAAARIHLGLGDVESLQVLNRLAERVRTRVLRGDGIDIGFKTGKDVYENFATHLATFQLLAAHYGLTKDRASRDAGLKVGESLEAAVGWSPPNSRAGFLVLASTYSLYSGGRPDPDDVKTAVEEFDKHFTDIVAYSTKAYLNLVQSLSMLSQLMRVANAAGVEPSQELAALWTVHIDYVSNTTEVKEASDYYLASAALTALVDAAENTHTGYSSKALEEALTLAEKLGKTYMVGDRILQHTYPAAYVLLLDPATPAERVFNEYAGKRVEIVDLTLPANIARLSKLADVKALEKVLELALEKVGDIQGYYRLIPTGYTSSEEFVNRQLRIQFISTVLAVERAPAARLRSNILQIILQTQPSFLITAGLLVLLAVLNRVGVLTGD